VSAAARLSTLDLMTRILSLAVLIFAPLLAYAGSYTPSMFRVALSNGSTSPDYVLIKVRGPKDQTERTVCTAANFLLGAIHREYDLGYTEADRKRGLEIALEQPERSFTFRKKEAMDNLGDDETPEALADVRRQFEGKKDAELLDHEFINSITDKRPDSKHRTYRDAVAHALLERGIGCKMGCVTDELFPHL
jgi:hypothetical protein